MDALFPRHDSAHGRAICLKSHNACTGGVPTCTISIALVFPLCLPLLSCSILELLLSLSRFLGNTRLVFAFSGRVQIVNRRRRDEIIDRYFLFLFNWYFFGVSILFFFFKYFDVTKISPNIIIYITVLFVFFVSTILQGLV